MQQVCPIESCTGCTACSSICPHSAIMMTADEYGFLYPKINQQKCIDCRLCIQTCPIIKHKQLLDNFPKSTYYAVRCLDLKELSKSQSGGAFYLLSQKILETGGTVYGACYGEGFRIEHHRATSFLERDGMRGSKYVQSDLNDIFKYVKMDLKTGKRVLFSGTPCQVAGLRSFIGQKNEEGLITVDLLCHGVASPLFWNEYLKMIEKTQKSTVTEIKMRDKTFGWLSSYETYIFGEKKIHKTTFYSLYYTGFISRVSCFHCPYTNALRPGDLSIGDYHGWNDFHHQYTDNSGISLVMVNSMRGEKFFNETMFDDNVYCESCDPSFISNVALSKPAYKAEHFYKFWQDFKQHGVEFVCKKYGNMSWRVQMHIKIYNLIRKISIAIGSHV